jgi:thymidylate synthase
MQDFELDYALLLEEILTSGTKKQTRNGETTSLFGMSVVLDNLEDYFPLIQGRRMYPKGVFGEFAAMVRGPKCKEDFTKWGCNFWEKWCKEDGSINVDYGNSWFDFEGFDQVAALKESLANNPNDRRMIISGWRPHRLHELDLPCCHYSYQFYVANGKLSMVWTQRSVDMMVGLPSDFILAALMVITLAKEFNLRPGKIKLDLGDCHIYKEHYEGAVEYCKRVFSPNSADLEPVSYIYTRVAGETFESFVPGDIALSVVQALSPIKLELKA